MKGIVIHVICYITMFLLAKFVSDLPSTKQYTLIKQSMKFKSLPSEKNDIHNWILPIKPMAL